MNNQLIRQANEWINEAGSIVLIGHHNPDGDAIGSVLALFHHFKAAGKNVSGLVPGDFPDFLRWMPGADDILVFETNQELVQNKLSEADLIFCLDFNAYSRVGKLEQSLQEASARKILIDHHPNPALEQFDLSFSKINTSSTAELVYQFIKAINPGQEPDKNTATAIYVGIMTDTGSFSFNANRPETFETTANLIRTGIDGDRIHKMVYDNYSESRLRLLGYCLSEKLHVLKDYKTAYISVTKDELERFNYKIGDLEGVVNYALSINGVIMAVMMTEKESKIRLSFRSKGDFPVNEIARKYFEGGGHRNAAGGDSFLSVDETILKLKEILEEYKARLNSPSY